jgi:hypothetical protein
MPDTCPCCGRPTQSDGDAVAYGRALMLSPHERVLFDRMGRSLGQWLPPATLIDALYADDPDGGPDKAPMALAAVVYGLRRKLRSTGLAIETAPGRGNGSRRLLWKSATLVKATLTGQVQPRVSEYSETHA